MQFLIRDKKWLELLRGKLQLSWEKLTKINDFLLDIRFKNDVGEKSLNF